VSGATATTAAPDASSAPRPATLALLRDLIAFDSVSHRPNLDIVAYVEALLGGFGITARRYPNAAGDKAALLATIGPADRPGIVLSAHLDVVPVDGQAWSSPPFEATLREGRVQGRGATDMKGFIACALAHVADFAAAARETPVHLALSYDEEVGCAGTADLVAAVAALPARPGLCIVGEPTGMRVARAHKGKIARRVTFRGKAGHSALPHRAANAVEAAAELAVRLSALGAGLRRRSDPSFEPPWSSVHVGSIHGGGALNIVPDHAVLEFEVRMLPGEDEAALAARLDAIVEEASSALAARAAEGRIEVEAISAYPGLDTPADGRAVALGNILAGRRDGPITIAFGTEAGLYDRAGVPTVVCGPGDIGRAHRADEWIGLDELAAADAMMARLAARLGTPLDSWAAGAADRGGA
jgi:acetylornithine deacetylase